MIDLAKNVAQWRSHGVSLLDGVDADAVYSAYRSIGWEPTPDVVSMYAQIGEIPGLDHEGWRIWSLDEVKAENAEKSAVGVYFSDYLVDCWRYLLVSRGTFSAVFRDNFDGMPPYQISPSLEKFFAEYLHDPVSALELNSTQVKSCRLTTACSDPGRHKVHAPNCFATFGVSAHAPHGWRPVADAGR
jgi:hypothetical protein